MGFWGFCYFFMFWVVGFFCLFFFGFFVFLGVFGVGFFGVLRTSYGFYGFLLGENGFLESLVLVWLCFCLRARSGFDFWGLLEYFPKKNNNNIYNILLK